MHLAFFVVLGHAVGAILLGWIYFSHYHVTRPPIGVFNLWDVALMVGAIVIVPYLYLVLPLWLVVGLLAAGFMSIIYFMLEPVLRTRWAIWVVTIVLLGVDIGTTLWFGATSTPFFAVNNVVLTVVIVGATNIWAQSGMKARDVAVLGGALTIYDFIFTSKMTLMTDLFSRLSGLPFAPMVAWHLGTKGLWLGIGLGDLLLATLYPLVMRKAFGRQAGIAAMVITLGAIVAIMMLPILGLLQKTFPVMVVLGPLMVLQYIYWARRRGQERTTWQYLQAESTQRQELLTTLN